MNLFLVDGFDWCDGKAQKIEIKPSQFVVIGLKSKEYIYLNKDDSPCSQESFVQQWKSYIKSLNIKSDPITCTHLNFLSDIAPMCQFNDYKMIKAVSEGTEKYYANFKKDVGHLRPCHILEYSGQSKFSMFGLGNSIKFEYKFLPPQLKTVYKEYLIFDMVGVIGSVGGTLGMCIGFSFSGIISTISNLILNTIK